MKVFYQTKRRNQNSSRSFSLHLPSWVYSAPYHRRILRLLVLCQSDNSLTNTNAKELFIGVPTRVELWTYKTKS